MTQKVFSTPKVFYVRDAKKFPFATVSYVSSCEKAGSLCVGVSVWDRQNPFKKSRGRAIAEGRAVGLYFDQKSQKLYATLMVDTAENTTDRHNAILKNLVENAKALGLPSGFVAAAQARVDSIQEHRQFIADIKAAACCGC